MSAKKPPEEKISNLAPFGLRMPPALREKIEARAASNNRSLNAEIVDMLETRLEEDKPEYFDLYTKIQNMERDHNLEIAKITVERNSWKKLSSSFEKVGLFQLQQFLVFINFLIEGRKDIPKDVYEHSVSTKKILEISASELNNRRDRLVHGVELDDA